VSSKKTSRNALSSQEPFPFKRTLSIKNTRKSYTRSIKRIIELTLRKLLTKLRNIPNEIVSIEMYFTQQNARAIFCSTKEKLEVEHYSIPTLYTIHYCLHEESMDVYGCI